MGCRRNTVRSLWLLTKTRSPSAARDVLHHQNSAELRCSACVSNGDCSFNCRGRERTACPTVSQARFIQLAHLLFVDEVMCQKSTVMMCLKQRTLQSPSTLGCALFCAESYSLESLFLFNFFAISPLFFPPSVVN